LKVIFMDVHMPCAAVLQVRQLFEELVVPFVCGHEGVASVLLGGSKAAGAALQEEAQQKLWQVCVVGLAGGAHEARKSSLSGSAAQGYLGCALGDGGADVASNRESMAE
jgi:hypothetical protein